MSGKFIVSLDFELQYGIEDFNSDALSSYQKSILGGRDALPRLLDLFKQHNIHATWAMVGMIAAKNKEELVSYFPDDKPSYTSPMSIYEHMDRLGNNETDDPFHYGTSLIKQILEVEGQEIGSHTFSHYYTQSDGQTVEQFHEDLLAANKIDKEKIGNEPVSLVLPRNQVNKEYLNAIKESGIKAFRGCQRGFVYNTPANPVHYRALKLIDTYFPIFGLQAYPSSEIMDNGLANIRASMFYRSYNRKLRFLEKRKVKLIKTNMKYAAENNLIFHLWWHPHNLGNYTEENFRNLDEIMEYYDELHSQYGFTSMNMKELYEELVK